MDYYTLKYDKEDVKEFELKEESLKRPYWSVLKKQSKLGVIPLLDRYSPLESIALEWSYVKAIEEVNDLFVSDRVQYLRSIFLELQNILWNIHYLRNVFQIIGDQYFSVKLLLLEESLYDSQEIWSGSRILPQYLKIGGVIHDLSLGVQTKLNQNLNTILSSLNQLQSELTKDFVVSERLHSKCCISREFIQKQDLSSIFALSVGINRDVRAFDSYGAFESVSIENRELNTLKLSSEKSCAWSRLMVSLVQAKNSIRILQSLMVKIPNGPIDLEIGELKPLENNCLFSQIQAPSGTILLSIIDNDIFIHSHSTKIKYFLAQLLEGVHFEDVELFLKSIAYEPSIGALH